MDEVEKPFGWRPLTQEQRERYEAEGQTPEQIAWSESHNVFSPDPTAVAAYYLSRSILMALTERLGIDFGRAVYRNLTATSESFDKSGVVEDEVDAKHISDLLEAPFWSSIGVVELKGGGTEQGAG